MSSRLVTPLQALRYSKPARRHAVTPVAVPEPGTKKPGPETSIHWLDSNATLQDPVSADTLRGWIGAGDVRPDTPVWWEGQDSWGPASRLMNSRAPYQSPAARAEEEPSTNPMAARGASAEQTLAERQANWDAFASIIVGGASQSSTATAEVLKVNSDDAIRWITTFTNGTLEVIMMRVKLSGVDWVRLDVKVAQLGDQAEELQALRRVLGGMDEAVVGGFVMIDNWLILRHAELLDRYTVEREKIGAEIPVGSTFDLYGPFFSILNKLLAAAADIHGYKHSG